jgi:hypothetical protein
MQLHFDTAALTAVDQKIIAALHEHFGGSPAAAAPAKSAPAAAAPKAAAKPAAKAEPEPEPEPEAPAETATSGATMQDAVDAATDMVANGKAGKVKEVLTSLGVKRVSELSEDQIQAFLDAVNA